MTAVSKRLAAELESIVSDPSLDAMTAKLLSFVERNAANADALPVLALQHADGTPIMDQGAAVRIDLAALARACFDGTARSDSAVVHALAIKAVRASDGHVYAWQPKMNGPGVYGWAAGAPGTLVDIDGERYADQPCILPRSCAILPGEWARLRARKYHQASLALETGCEPLVLSIADMGGDRNVLTMEAAKIGILFSTSAVEQASTTIRAITECTHPSADRLQARDFVATGRALAELDRLFVFTPGKTKLRVFTIAEMPRSPEETEPGMDVRFGVNWALKDARKRLLPAYGDEYNGTFPISLSGIMGIPNTKALEFRFYIRSAAAINAAHEWIDPKDKKRGVAFNRDALIRSARTADEWARILNAYSQASLDYLAARDGSQRHYRSATKDRRRVLEAAEDLLARKLGASVHVENPKGDRRHVLMPSEAHLEAQQAFNKRKRFELEDVRYREPTDHPMVERTRKRKPLGLRAQANRAALLVGAFRADRREGDE